MIQNILKISRIFGDHNRVVQSKLICLDKEKSLSSLLSSIGWKLITIILGSNKKAIARIRSCHKFFHYLIVMKRRHGSEHVIKFLKASQLAVSKFLAGEPLKSFRDLGPDFRLPRLRSCGLPTIIGTRDVRSLHACSPKVIQLWLTIFSVYRIIDTVGKPKLNTITDSFSGNLRFLEFVEDWMEHKAPAFLARFQVNLQFKHQDRYSMDEKASATNKKSWLGMLTDLSILESSPIYSSFLYIAKETLTPNMYSTMIKLIQHVPGRFDEANFHNLPCKKTFSLYSKSDFLLGLGQLAKKEEAAGKVRIFAMVDSWTQTILLPVHAYLSSLLKQIPQDGTASHSDAFDRARKRSQEFGCAYGYDLSSATDRLPISIQTKLIGALFGGDFGSHWAKLLVGRPYYMFEEGCKPLPFYYEVGQPMGARSSFTMLGLTHHMLVQLASHLITNSSSWETRYEIVGDDIVIFNKELAESYLEVMSLLGVPINLSKSVVAKNRSVVEFVKRVSVKGYDVSPLSWQQFLSQNTYLGRLATTVALLTKDKALVKRALGVFHNVMSVRLGDRVPQKDYLALITLYMTYALKNNMSLQELIKVFLSLGPKIESNDITFVRFNAHHIGAQLKGLMNGILPKHMDSSPLFQLMVIKLNNLYQIRLNSITVGMPFEDCRWNETLIIQKLFALGFSEKTFRILKSYFTGLPDAFAMGGHYWPEPSAGNAYPLTKDYANAAIELPRHYELLQDLMNQKSFYKIHERVDEHKADEIREIDEKISSLLKDIVEAYRLVLKDQARSERS